MAWNLTRAIRGLALISKPTAMEFIQKFKLPCICKGATLATKRIFKEELNKRV